MALHPARHALVVARREVHAIPRRRVRDALAARCIPDGRVRHTRDLPALEPWVRVLDLGDALELLVRRPLHAFVRRLRAAIQLHDAVQHAVVVHRPPRAGKRLAVPEVVAAQDVPSPARSGRQIEGLDHVAPPVLRPQLLRVRVHARLVRRHQIRLRAKIFKKLPLENVPRALQPCRAQLRGQLAQLGDILRLRLHQRAVVRHQRLDEAVVLRPLGIFEAAIHEQALEVSVRRSAGV